MPILRERIETSLPVEEAFAFIADFANSMRWDPGVATSQRVDPGPVGVGARYRLGVRMRGRVTPMEYRITDFDPLRRVVLAGSGSGVTAVDDIAFAKTPTGGTVIDYTADIRLGGWMRLIQPFAGGAFAGVARKAADGMRRTLAAMADEGVAAGARA
jgi:carbon monoxide dehydrogenase subunit G